ncbi:MAG: hypothetical protein M0035_12000 [Actinomycetota bacterium]|nr:hypothetical protein [Actinomycetota bacterium]
MFGEDGANSSADERGAGAARDTVRSTILELVASNGEAVADDPRRVEAFLRDLCGEHPAEISVAVAALRAGVAAELKMGGASGTQPLSLVLPRLTARLHQDLGIDESLSRWAVGTWALALHRASEALVNSLDFPPEGTGPIAPRPERLMMPRQGQAGESTTWPGGEETASATAGTGTHHEDATDRGIAASGGASAATSLLAGLKRLRTWRSRLVAASLLVIVVAGTVSYFTGGGSSGTHRGAPAPAATSPPPVGSKASSVAEAFSVPPLGTYRYETSVANGNNSETAPASPGTNISTAEVVRVGNQIGVAWTGFGNSTVQSNLYDMSTKSIVETSLELLDSSGSATSSACVWSPPIVEYEEPLTPGRTWSASSSCSLSVSGAQGEIQFTQTANVARDERVRVPLGTFEAVLVDVTQTTTVTPAEGSATSDSETDAIAIDPSTGIPISEALYDQQTGQTVTAKLEGFTPLASGSSSGAP